MEYFANRHSYYYPEGSLRPHWFRRFVHLSSLLIPFIYYHFENKIMSIFGIGPRGLLIGLLIIMVILEGMRIKLGWHIYGQRHYEKKYISAFTWGIGVLILVILLAPSRAYALPIIAAYAIVDPLVGELRRLKTHSNSAIFTIGCMGVMLIWLLASGWFGIPWWLAFIMGPLTMAVEWPNLKWIDDNALMQFIPLVLVLVLDMGML